jgi:hypothetical protein
MDSNGPMSGYGKQPNIVSSGPIYGREFLISCYIIIIINSSFAPHGA